MLSAMEYERLYKHFDSSNTGYIIYNAFVEEVRGKLNSYRR